MSCSCPSSPTRSPATWASCGCIRSRRARSSESGRASSRRCLRHLPHPDHGSPRTSARRAHCRRWIPRRARKADTGPAAGLVSRSRRDADSTRRARRGPHPFAGRAAPVARHHGWVHSSAPGRFGSRGTIPDDAPDDYDYVTVLERIFLLDRLPPWYSKRSGPVGEGRQAPHGRHGTGVCPARDRRRRVAQGSRSTRTVAGDVRASGTEAPGELVSRNPWTSFTYREANDFEVDIVLERGSASVPGIEVKTTRSNRDRAQIFAGCASCVMPPASSLLPAWCYTTSTAATRFGANLFAMPLRSLVGGLVRQLA